MKILVCRNRVVLGVFALVGCYNSPESIRNMLRSLERSVVSTERSDKTPSGDEWSGERESEIQQHREIFFYLQ